MRTYMKYLWSWRTAIVLLALCAPLSACAGGLADMLRDKIIYEIQVVDMHGRPIPAATIWWMLPEDRSFETPELMERLLRRYATDADFVQSTALHPSLLVDRTDKNGLALIQVDGGGVEGHSRVVAYFAALKRGYHSAFVQDTARTNTTHSITIRLDSKANAQVDARMLAFDLLRAPTPSGGPMSEERHQYLQGVQQRLRALAQELEEEQLFDEASAVYYNLAYLPSVETMLAPDGRETIVGFTNGYDERNPQRRADLERAIALNRSTPYLLLSKTVLEVHAQGGLVGPKQSAARQKYIRATEDIISRYPERLWPKDFSTVFYAYMNEGLYNESCSAFKRAYEFEPSYQSPKLWHSELKRLNAKISKENTSCGPCKVEIRRNEKVRGQDCN